MEDYIIIKEKSHQEDITVLNTYVSNARTTNFMNEIATSKIKYWPKSSDSG